MGEQQVELLTKREAARLLRVSTRTLSSFAWRARYGLPSVRVGGQVRFSAQELRQWLEARQRQFPGDAA
jgi:excisionase family DNA binding protein